MKKTFLVVLMLITAVVGCKKEERKCPPVTIAAPSSEIETLRTYIQANNITAVEDARGFFFTIDQPGTGTKPDACSDVLVDYVGRLTDGSVFDSGNDVSFNLSRLIIGWQEGIPLIASGGSITLYLPPSLAYGPSANGSIPANSNLIFTINLKTVY